MTEVLRPTQQQPSEPSNKRRRSSIVDGPMGKASAAPRSQFDALLDEAGDLYQQLRAAEQKAAAEAAAAAAAAAAPQLDL